MTILSVVIPAYNEENGIKEIAERVLAVEPALKKAGVERLEPVDQKDPLPARPRLRPLAAFAGTIRAAEPYPPAPPPTYPPITLSTWYEVDPNWPQRPEGMPLGRTPGVFVDGQDQVWLFTRANPPVQIYTTGGKFVRAWGEGLGLAAVQGNVLDPAFASFVGLYPVPMRHGMTPGELARLFAGEFGIGVELHVVPVEGWRREMHKERALSEQLLNAVLKGTRADVERALSEIRQDISAADKLETILGEEDIAKKEELIKAMQARVPVPGPQNGRYAAEPLAGLTSLTKYDSGRTQYNASAELAVTLGHQVRAVRGVGGVGRVLGLGDRAMG